MNRYLKMLILCAALAACDADFANGVREPGPGPIPSDVTPPFDIPRPDGFGPTADVGPDTAAFKDLPSKNDEVYTVPPTVARKSAVTAGAGRVAWIAAGAVPGELNLRVWDLGSGALPETVVFHYLANPSELALGANHLYFVDDVWGDKDIYAIDLKDQSFTLVAGGPGDQRAPAALGSRVVWQDCRSCVPGAESAESWEIYEHDIETGDTFRVTTNEVPDQTPTLGTMRDGSIGLAWVSAYTRLRLIASDTDFTHDTGAIWVESVALAAGQLAWRASPAIVNPDSMIPSPMIVNPDSMIPSDVQVVDPANGEVTTLTTHAEVGAETPLHVVGYGSRVGFAQLPDDPIAPFAQRLRVFDLGGLHVEVVSITEAGITELTLGDQVLGFVAPRADNEDQPDVWLTPIPPQP